MAYGSWLPLKHYRHQRFIIPPHIRHQTKRAIVGYIHLGSPGLSFQLLPKRNSHVYTGTTGWMSPADKPPGSVDRKLPVACSIPCNHILRSFTVFSEAQSFYRHDTGYRKTVETVTEEKEPIEEETGDEVTVSGMDSPLVNAIGEPAASPVIYELRIRKPRGTPETDHLIPWYRRLQTRKNVKEEMAEAAT